ncbi:MAG: hypothetical protein JSW11_15015 [Candidatus Heimdallarchaeota archaeon]|nr:MAG: hypothetical protein JSW11_15015 [Candidatus Heimdallarchaeota archaeon]
MINTAFLLFPFYTEALESFNDPSRSNDQQIIFNENKQEKYQSISELRNNSPIRSGEKRPSFSLESNFNLSVLKPVSNGTKSEIPSENPVGGIHWQLVSDINDSSYIIEDYSTATSYTETYQSQNISGISGTINSVSLYIRVRTSIAFTNARAWTVLRTYDKEYVGPLNEPLTSWNNYSTKYLINPNTSVNWTWDEVNTMEIGVMLRALPQQDRECWCSEVWAEVNYTQTFDLDPPSIIDHGVEDLGNGTGVFWADIRDTLSSVDTTNISINNTEYSMINNGSYWIYPKAVLYKRYYEFQIINSSDSNGNYISSPSDIKSYSFNSDVVAPIVDTPVYNSTLGDNGTFKVNIRDPWGEVDTVLVNVTFAAGVPQHKVWAVMINTTSGYMTKTLPIDKGIFHYVIIANDTKGNRGTSNEIISSVPNHFPEVTDLRLSSDQDRLQMTIFSNDTLFVQYMFFDRDGDNEGGTEIHWYKNGVIQPAHNDSRLVTASYLTKNDQWFITVKPKDAQEFGIKQTSDTITILNVPPNVCNYSYIFDSRSQIIPEIRSTLLGQVFFIEDEDISLFYEFEDSDHPIDYDQSLIQWYSKLETSEWEEVFTRQNSTFIPSSETSPGEYWKCKITPYDGTELGKSVPLNVIYIESRPCILNYSVSPIILDDKGMYFDEGKYKFQVVTSSLNPIATIEFIINDSSEGIYYAQKSQDNNSIWILDYNIPPSEFCDNYMGKIFTTKVRACSFVDYQDQEFMIYANYTFLFGVEDKCPPRVVGKPSVTFDSLDPSNITFFSYVIDYGSEIEEVFLYYYFREIDETTLAGIGASLPQKDIPWQVIQMSLLSVNETNVIHSYSVTVPFEHNDTSRAIIYYIKTTDSSGNTGIPYNILNDPERIREFHFEKDAFLFDPLLVIILIVFTIILTLLGSILYLRIFRKPELIGFDEEIVLNNISEVSESEIMEILDIHTVGVVIAFFDQQHGPIPIIITPEILKDNFPKLIELSDRSFGTIGFIQDFERKITSNFDFLLSKELLITSLSFGFALQRPDARGGQENLIMNILIYPDVFPFINQFLDEIREKVDIVHKLMDKDSSKKELILSKIIDIRKYISQIILAYEKTYGTTDLLTT